MKNFYIKNITVSGEGKEDSVVDFIDGLNIVSGPSNTGKTWILKCIDFLFGSDNPPFTVEHTGYHLVRMTVESAGKILTATREIGNEKTKNKIVVDSNIPKIESGIYATQKGKRSVNVDLWPKLIGIEPGQTIIGRITTGKRYALTWRSISHMFLIKSESIIKENPILLPPQNTAETPALSALLFLITGNDFSSVDSIDNKDIQVARKKAVVDFINGRLQSFAKRKNELSDIEIRNPAKIQELADKIVSEIIGLEQEMNSAIMRLKQVSVELSSLYEKLTESIMLQSRFAELKTRYIADIKRLSFIIEGETQRQGLVRNKKCPFCEHAIQERISPTYFDAAASEMKRTELQLKDLTESETDVLSRIQTLRQQINVLEKEKTNLDLLLNKELKPKLSAQRLSLAEYKKAIAIQSEIDAIFRFENSLREELIKKETEEDKELAFKIKSHFTAEIITGIEERIVEILKVCNFTGYNSAHFGIENFDLTVNGLSKSGNGEGYCAFLNTVMALAMMEYLTQSGVYAPSLLVVDSPILTLMERNGKTETESIKNGLFRYLLDNQDNGQIIIIDQKIPDLDYEGNAQVIRFTQDEAEGRYGFLDGVRHYD